MADVEDTGTADDALRVAASIPLRDGIDWHASLLIERFTADATTYVKSRTGLLAPQREDFERLGVTPYNVSVVENNLLTTAGLGRIATLCNAGTGNLIASTTVRVGTGDGGGSAAIGDTDLSAAAGSTHRWFQTCTVTIPSNVFTFVAAFGSADGNYAWNEWGADIGTATVTSGNTVNAVLLNHKTSIAQGTKASGQTWTATATITIS